MTTLLSSTLATLFPNRTTAEQALGQASLSKKTAIVTGANSGIGVETARVLALGGASVILACRNTESGAQAKTQIERSLRSNHSPIDVLALDLTDLRSVRQFAEQFAARHASLDLLINNAGVMATPLGHTAQGHELQVGTNHIGHFLLTTLLRPWLERAPESRVVTVSSALHTQGRTERLFETLESDPGFSRRKYSPFAAYGDSKLANVLFTRHLSRLLPSHVEAFSVHPGVIATNLTRSMGTLGDVFQKTGKLFMKTVAQGAATSVFAATSPRLSGYSGAYLAECEVARPSRAASDDSHAERLWRVSERIVEAYASPLAASTPRSNLH